ncbi:hypothetical protein ACIRO3_06020 [Streptomyces sp. NPDC102278]|uniref:hypothetical protein n=1 Tax=Streptomyces sp. NPDC102278 TaxID=3366152 RepID=UPI0037F8999A
MPSFARLLTTIAPVLPPAGADAPHVESWSPSRRLLVQRGDAELVVQELAGPVGGRPPAPPVRIPAPWPRRFGRCAVAPSGDVAVFSGVHALTAVDRTGAVRWEVRHRCWAGCASHDTFEEYAHDRGHRYASGGSAVFSADGALVWAHVRGPLERDDHERDGHGRAAGAEEWLVVDAADGRILARAATGSAAAGSVHVPHVDPGQMGLSIGEGQDGAPLRWGRWDGERLSVDSFAGEALVLSAVSPGGARLLTVTHGQEALVAHRLVDGSADPEPEAELRAEEVIPRHPEADPDAPDVEAFWDYEAAFLDEHTVIAGTVESDEESGAGRYWIVDLARRGTAEPLVHPYPVTGTARALGDGTWYTVSPTDHGVRIWGLR